MLQNPTISGAGPYEPQPRVSPWVPPGPLSRVLDPTPLSSHAMHALILTLGALNFGLAQGPSKGKSDTGIVLEYIVRRLFC